ncbi:MAG: helix-turn-helix transcriptional regulator [Spirochaetaceae bacterium]|nr:helix-turn-helix transcriptional regulator [Spirochaetaceae bacterium]
MGEINAPYYSYEQYDLDPEFPFSLDETAILTDEPIVGTKPNQHVGIHLHNVLEIGYCHDGHGVFLVGTKTLLFEQGDVSIIMPGESHVAHTTKGSKSRWSFMFIDIDRFISLRFPEWADFNWGLYSGPRFSNILRRVDHPDVSAAVSRIVWEVTRGAPHWRELITALVIEVAVCIARLDVEEPNPDAGVEYRTMSRLNPAVNFLRHHFGEKITVGDLADVCAMSQRNFVRLFAKSFLRSPQQYIAEFRVSMACNRLKNSSDLVGKVSTDNGFPTVSSFNRKFKELMGVSPSDWRKGYA